MAKTMTKPAPTAGLTGEQVDRLIETAISDLKEEFFSLDGSAHLLEDLRDRWADWLRMNFEDLYPEGLVEGSAEPLVSSTVVAKVLEQYTIDVFDIVIKRIPRER